jgi:hypothetical protein
MDVIQSALSCGCSSDRPIFKWHVWCGAMIFPFHCWHHAWGSKARLVGRFADLRVSLNANEDTVNRNRCRPRFGTPTDGQCVNTVSIPRETGVKKYVTKRVVIIPVALYNQNVQRTCCTQQTPMPSSPPRILILRAHLLEMIISGAAIGLGLFMWLSTSGSNSGINLLAGAALLVAGFMVFVFAMKSILKF